MQLELNFQKIWCRKIMNNDDENNAKCTKKWILNIYIIHIVYISYINIKI